MVKPRRIGLAGGSLVGWQCSLAGWSPAFWAGGGTGLAGLEGQKVTEPGPCGPKPHGLEEGHCRSTKPAAIGAWVNGAHGWGLGWRGREGAVAQGKNKGGPGLGGLP